MAKTLGPRSACEKAEINNFPRRSRPAFCGAAKNADDSFLLAYIHGGLRPVSQTDFLNVPFAKQAERIPPRGIRGAALARCVLLTRGPDLRSRSF